MKNISEHPRCDIAPIFKSLDMGERMFLVQELEHSKSIMWSARSRLYQGKAAESDACSKWRKRVLPCSINVRKVRVVVPN